MLKTIKFLFLFFFLIIISSGAFLYSGIKINSFSFGDISVSQFYIKLDKKLIVDVDKIIYKSKKSEVKNSYEDLKTNIELLPNILKIFQKVHVERLEIDGNAFTIELNDEAIYLDNKFVNLSSKLDFRANQVIFDLYSLYLKDVELLFEGKVKLDYFKEKLDYFGTYDYQKLSGNINLEMTQKQAKFYLNSKPFESLKFLKKYVRLSEVAENWMYDNVKGDIELKSFYGTVNLEKKEVLLDSLKGNALIKNPQVTFHKDLDVVKAKSVYLDFYKNKLSFSLNEPKYKGIALDGSSVNINNLTSEENGNVEISIKAQAKLDKEILKILKAFKVNIPIVQTKGLTNANVYLKVPYILSKDMITKGEFDAKNSSFAINNFNFSSKSAKVYLDGTNIKIKNADFKYKNMINATVNSMDLDTKTLKAKAKAKIKSLYIGSSKKEEILHIKNKNSSIDMDFNKKVKLELQDLSTNLDIVDEFINIQISDLSKIYPYSKLLKDNSIKKGNISLKVKDENNLSFKALVQGLNYPIEKNGKKVSSLNILGSIKQGNLAIASSDDSIKLEQKANQTMNLRLKNYDVILDTKTKGTNEIPKLNIVGSNLRLKIDDEIYNLVKAKANLSSKKIDFEARVKNLELPLRKKGKDVKTLDIKGFYKDDITNISTINNDLTLKLKKDSLKLKLDSYDVLYDINEKDDESTFENIDIVAKKSNIILNKKYKFLADNFELQVRENSKYFNLKHKKTDLTFKENKDKKIDIFANDISSSFLNTIYDKEILKGGKLMLIAKGTIDNLDGKILVENTDIQDLAILNNLLLFIHTSPALINPFLAIPSVLGMATNGGFNLTAYKVIDGNIAFNYSKKREQLKIKRLITVGNGIDFEGNGVINLKDMSLDSKVKLIFLKDYSSIVGAIPVVNYVLLGKNKRVETQVGIKGALNNPKISTNFTKEAFSVPVNIAKRILSSPAKLLEFIQEANKKNKK